ncbi:MAG TPA: histidine kinase [Bryobacteraceae bacterium]|nr:histidine kinase [Bryobacteraceae bacterium]
MRLPYALPYYFLVTEMLGFGTGVVLSILLVMLVRRASHRGSGMAMFAFCALLWNVGGLVTFLLLLSGLNPRGLAVSLAHTSYLSAGALFPISFFLLWSQPLPPESRQARLNCWLRRIATVNAIVIIVCIFACFFVPGFRYLSLTMYAVPFNASILLTIGAFTQMKGRLGATADRAYLILTLVGIWGSTVAILLLDWVKFPHQIEALLVVAKEQSPFLALLGALFFFAKFRSSDVLIKSSFRVVAAVCISLWACFILAGSLPGWAVQWTHFPRAARDILSASLLAAILLLFPLLDFWIRRAVDRWILRQPDYRGALRQLWDEMAQLDQESELFTVVDRGLCPLLDIEAARVLKRSEVPGIEAHAGANAGQFWELSGDDPCRCALRTPDVEVLVPVRVHGNITHVIAVAPGVCRRSLLNVDLKFLHDVATQIGSRLESLAHERERIERQSREAKLRHLATEAELKALRAQINPHFLFNSLNTVADLIVTDPAKAETMTVLLAKVFRHLLMHSDRQLTRVSEEMDFLRTYLQIEEVRFGDRLRVRMEVDPAISKEKIPSLILQPVVENAIKHGLAPKVGDGSLCITAQQEGDFVRLAVEDDGVGPAEDTRTGEPQKNGGVGLKIIGERLRTLYNGRATLSFEKGVPCGSRVTILIPRNAAGV